MMPRPIKPSWERCQLRTPGIAIWREMREWLRVHRIIFHVEVEMQRTQLWFNHPRALTLFCLRWGEYVERQLGAAEDQDDSVEH